MTASLALLPTVGERRLAVRVTPDAFRQIRGGSPWLYDGSITSVSHDGAPGDLAVIFDDDRKFAAIGLWDPTFADPRQGAAPGRSGHDRPPVVAVTRRRRARPSRRADRRHRPPPRIDASTARTTACPASSSTATTRLPWSSCTRRRGSRTWPCSSTCWSSCWPLCRVVLRLSRSVASGETFGLADGDTIVGEAPNGSGARSASVVSPWKPTSCTARRPGTSSTSATTARWCAAWRRVPSVLDVFASTGGFSRGGRRRRCDVGAPRRSVGTGARHGRAQHRAQPAPGRGPPMRRAHHRRRRVQGAGRPGASKGEHFDIVIVDPPSFASNQAAVPRALAGVRPAHAVGARGGRARRHARAGVVFEPGQRRRVRLDTCSTAAASAGADVHETRRTGHAVDHPIGFEYGGYLKAVYLTVRGTPSRS